MGWVVEVSYLFINPYIHVNVNEVKNNMNLNKVLLQPLNF